VGEAVASGNVESAKDVVEADRSAHAAMEGSYRTLVTKLHPLNASAKNEVLVGPLLLLH
jgi:hypothetical protein